MHACYRPSPAPINVSGNTSNDFIRSRTKPAFRIRYSQPFKGVERYCQENYESRGKSLSTERSSLGFCPYLYGELGKGCPFSPGLQTGRPRQTLYMPAGIAHSVWATFVQAPALSVEPVTVWVQLLCGMVTDNCKKNKSPLQIRLEAVCVTGRCLIFIADCKLSRHQKPSRGLFT